LGGKKPALQKSHFCFDYVNRLIIQHTCAKKRLLQADVKKVFVPVV